MCFSGYITVDKTTPSESGLYVTDLPGVTIAQLDGLTKDEQADFNELFDTIYKNAQINLKIDVQRKLAQRFHIDRKLVSRETSAFLDEENTDTSLSGVKIDFNLPKYALLKVLSIGLDLLESPISEWETVIGPANVFWSDVIFAQNKFVAVGNSTIATSEDGINWTLQTSPIANNWNRIAYGNGLFVVIQDGSDTGPSDKIITSADGFNWTIRTVPSTTEMYGVTYGNGKYVITGASIVYYSVDAITWSSGTPSILKDWVDVFFAKGIFVAIAQAGVNNRVMTSVNGSDWTTRTTPTDYSWASIAFGEDLFVVVNSDTGANLGKTMTSPDGITWTLGSSGRFTQKVIYANNNFLAVGDPEISVSVDGITWTQKANTQTGDHPPDNAGYNGFAYGNNTFILVGEGIVFGYATSKVDIDFYEENEDGDLLKTVSESATEGRSTIQINEDFEVDSLFVAVDPTRYNLNKTENKYFPNSTYYNFDKLSCTFPCFYGQASIQQINGGGLNVKFVVYCSMDKFICENLNLFQYALWYRIGVDLMKERIVSDRVTRFTVISEDRATELMTVFNDEYQHALDAATMNIKMQEDPICFSCKSPIRSKTSLP